MRIRYLLLCSVYTGGVLLLIFASSTSAMQSFVSYDWDSIMNPGKNSLFISVDDGAPCVAHCNVRDDSLAAVAVTSFQQHINESRKIYEKLIDFRAAGRYVVKCNFIPQDTSVGASEIELKLFISESVHPVIGQTDSPRKIEEALNVDISFGSWTDIRLVTAWIYFEPSSSENEYVLGKPEYIERKDSSSNLYVGHEYGKPGIWKIRADIVVNLRNALKYVQLLLTAVIADDIEYVRLDTKCISLCNGQRSYSISKKDYEDVTMMFPYQARIEASVSSKSIITEWEWFWGSASFSRRHPVEIRIANYMPMSVTVRNAFSQMTFSFELEYKIVIEDSVIAFNDSTDEKGPVNIAVIFTSPQDAYRITNAKPVEVAVQIKSSKSWPIPKATAVPPAQQKCYENSTASFSSFLDSWDGLSGGNYRQDIFTYCVRNLQYFPEYHGPYDVLSIAQNRVYKREAEYSFCVRRSPTLCAKSFEAKIRDGGLGTTTTAYQNIVLFGEYLAGHCDSAYDHELFYNWTLTQKDTSTLLLVGYENEFFISGKYLTVSEFIVTLQLSKRGLCGEHDGTAYDTREIKTYQDIEHAVTISGGQELILYVDNATKLLFEVENAAAYHAVQYKWYCCKMEQEKQFEASYYSGDLYNTGGCLGSGFHLSDGVRNISRTGSRISIDAGMFRDIPGKFKIRVSLRSKSVYDDQYIELRESTSDLTDILGSYNGSIYHPRLSIECIFNCEKYLDTSSTLTLEGRCDLCATDSSDLETIYQWSLHGPAHSNLYSLITDSWREYSFTKLDEFPQEIRLRSAAFTRTGAYKIQLTIAIRNESTFSQYQPIGSAYYYVIVAPDVSSTFCYIRPSSGYAAATNFTLGCSSSFSKGSNVYEFRYSDCLLCENEDSYELFYRGYSADVSGILLPKGERRFGYRLIIKITKTNIADGKSSSSYIFVQVESPTVQNAFEILKASLREGSTVTQGMMQKDAVKSVAFVSSLLSVAEIVKDEEVRLEMANRVLEDLQRVNPSSLDTMKHYTSMLKKLAIFISGHNSSKYDGVVKVAETVSILAEQISYLLQTSEELTQAPFMNMFGVIGICMRDARNMSSSKLKTTVKLSKDLAKLIVVNKKPLGEYPTVLQNDNLLVSISNSRFQNYPSRVNLLQTGFAMTGLLQQNVPRIIQAGLAKFSFNPMAQQATDNTPVVGLVLAAQNATGDTYRPAKQRGRSTPQFIETSSVLRGTILHLLLPTPTLERSIEKTIRLPQPCLTSNASTASTLSRSSTEPCGYALITLSFDGFTNSEEESNRLTASESYANFRPSRPCRIPTSPCIEVLMLRRIDDPATIHKTLDIEVEDCSPLETNDCVRTYAVLETAVLPAHTRDTQLPDEFTPDPWSVYLNDEVINTINSDGVTLVVVIKHLQRDIYSLTEDSLDSHLNITVDFFSASCLVWNGTLGWHDHFCERGRPTIGGSIHCECNVDQLNFDSPDQEPNMIFFTANLVIAPNRIAFEDIVSILLRIRSHYYVLAVVFLFWLIFILSFLWARRDDSIDASMREIQIPVDSNLSYNHLYEVVISTAVFRAAGTSAKVQIMLEGEYGTTTDINTISTENHSTLQRSGKDSFLIAAPQSLGQVVKIHVWHDNGGEYPSWHLNRVAVFDLQNKDQPPSYFLVNSWLSQDIYPFRCHLTANVSKDSELYSFRTMWGTYAFSAMSERDVWLTSFFKPRGSQFTRMRRLACLATAFFGTMLVTNMFIQAGSQNYYFFNLGFAEIDLSPIIIAIESIVLTAPVHLLLVYVFNRIETEEEIEINNALEMYNNGQQFTEETREASTTPYIQRPRKYENGTYSRVRECYVLTKEVHSLRRLNEGSNDGYDSSDDDFDIHETLSDCLDIKRIAEEIAAKCPAKSASQEQRKVRVRIVEEEISQSTTSLSELIGVEKHEVHDGQAVWYKRFRAKRILRAFRRRNSNTGSSGLVQSINDNLFPRESPYENTLNALENFASLVNTIVFLPRTKGAIPEWVGGIVWCLTWIYVIVCSIISVLYGLSFERSKFLMWLTTFLLSIVQSILIAAPLERSLLALLAAMIGKKSIHIDQWAAYTGKAQRIHAVVKWRQMQREERLHGDAFARSELTRESSEKLKGDTSSYPPPFLSMIKRGKRALAVRQVKRYWYETFVWIVIATFVSILIAYQRNPQLLRINQGLAKKLQYDLGQVSTRDDVYDFLQHNLIPVLFKEDEISMFLQFKLLGPIHMRQWRFTGFRDCTCDSRIDVRQCKCLPLYGHAISTESYDSISYTDSWSNPITNNTSTIDFHSPFIYQQCAESETDYPFGSNLYRSFYPCGGYTVDLGFQAKQASAIINSLKYSGWIDRFSAALIVEFAILDTPSGYATPFLYVMEFLPTGGIHVFQYSTSYRQFYIYEMKDLAVIGLQILHVAISIYLVYSTLTEYSDVKWNPKAVVGIFMNPWHLIQIMVAAITFIAYGYYLKHITVAETSSGTFKADPSKFVSFLNAAYHFVTYTNLISVGAFLCYVRLLKILRGSESVVVMLNTISVARDGVGNVAFLISAVTVGFALTGIASLASTRLNFRHFPTAFTTLTSVGAGMDVPHPEHGVTEEILWSIYFLLFAIFVLTFYSNLYATVISDALFFTKNENSKETSYQVETLALHWVYEKLVSLFGFKSRAFSGKSIKLRPPPGSVLNRDDIAKEMRLSLTVDPDEGPAQKRLLTRRGSTKYRKLTNLSPENDGNPRVT